MSPAFWIVLGLIFYVTMIWITRVVLDLLPATTRRDRYGGPVVSKDLKVILSIFWWVTPFLLLGWGASYSVTHFMKSAEAVARRVRENRELVR